ncbi:TonB-dependent receptor [Fulvivirga sedimenti]|uniref:TonB-dependent receptor n=1 Tax=Fulvivirga sedimenti TaxID=2879465 RepID=A0A9X1KWI1_9BACT|nr:TonB-dependent receptor [Fulvivirga sedimenti]MCA6073984.1 TonB-dependent receptor [Fulvivirga sedimenti]
MKAVVAILLCLLSLPLFEASAQTFTVNRDNATLDDIISDLEASSGYTFYFKSSELDTVKFDLSVTGSIDQVLTSLFSGTGYEYAILPGNMIIISPQNALRLTLPAGFFDVNSNAPLELDPVALTFNDSESDEDLAEQNELENQLIPIGDRTALREGVKVNINGYVRKTDSGEGVVGAMVYVENPNVAAATDIYGYYTLTLPQGRHTVRVRSLGMKETKREVIVYAEGSLDIEMKDDVIALKEVVVQAEKTANVTGLQMGMERLDITKVKQVPTVLGEADIIKVALTLPGVQTVGEGSSGFNVRGGATDQNLILINDAVIYNPSHFFGFFSVFNPDVIKNATLLKSGIPAEYGGRISSVLDINSKDGNKRKFGVQGGISPVTARVAVEGPIIKDKMSFVIGGRSTYSDWLLKQVPDNDVKNSNAAFYDISAKISTEFSDKDALYLSGYFSKDKFQLYSDSLIQYQNLNGSVKWKHVFSPKLFAVVTGSYSDYQYELDYEGDSLQSFNLNYRLTSVNGKLDFSYFPSEKHKVDFGASVLRYDILPGEQVPLNPESDIVPIRLEDEAALESAVYVGDNFDLSDRLSLYLGLRYSFYQYLGPRTVFSYRDGFPKSSSTLTDTTQYGKNDVISRYHGPEYRLSARYTLNRFSSLKLSFNRSRQYIQTLSNTTAITPTDTWKLSDPHVKPQVGDQVALGYYRNFRNNSIEGSIEVYYKTIQDVLEYKGGAKLILNPVIEQDLLTAMNKSYGVEFLLKKKVGKLDGWISYTYSRSLNRVDGESSEERINNGEYFPSNFDKPHSLNVIGNFKFSRRVNVSGSFVYSTGRPITYPVAKYFFNGSERVYYSGRNEFRIPDYLRLDISLQLEGNHKVDKPAHSSWSFAVYNLLGRKNAYSVFFVAEQGEVNGYKLSVFGSAIPTITYNFNFR